MKFYSAFVLASLAIAARLPAQSANSNAAANSSAATVGAISATTKKSSDEQWATVIGLAATSSPKADVQPGKSAVQRANDARQAALSARSAAQAAKDFYTNCPTHINAPEAKKMEALLALQGVTDGDPAYEASAKQVATRFRQDTRNPAPDRFEVAVLSERVDARAQLGGTPFGNVPGVLEPIADKLLAEFGDLPDAHYFYASVARTADMGTAGRMAAKILQSKAAPAEAKSDAQAIIDRMGLLGNALPLQLQCGDGTVIDLSKQVGKLTIVYVWPGLAGTGPTAPLSSIKKKLPADAQVVYLPLGATVEQASALVPRLPIPGLLCVGEVSNTGFGVDRLSIRTLPYVFIIDRTGKLQSFGPAATVATLLAGAR